MNKKKRVAFCLSGGVSNKNGKSLIISDNDNDYINYKACFNSIKHHILNYNKNYIFDIFMHCWTKNLEMELVNLYQPKKSLFENNLEYLNQIINKCNFNLRFYSQLSKALSNEKVINLALNYSKENNFSYDIIIIYRYEFIIIKKSEFK